MFFLAVVWHFWVGVSLAAGSVFAVLGVLVGYVVKVRRPQYPRNS